MRNFQVLYEKPNALNDVLIHCWDGDQLVLAFVSREALDDYFRSRSSLTIQQRNLLVDRNLDIFKRIIEKKYKNGQHSTYSRLGQDYKRIDIKLFDIERNGERLTDQVLDIASKTRFIAA